MVHAIPLVQFFFFSCSSDIEIHRQIIWKKNVVSALYLTDLLEKHRQMSYCSWLQSHPLDVLSSYLSRCTPSAEGDWGSLEQMIPTWCLGRYENTCLLIIQILQSCSRTNSYCRWAPTNMSPLTSCTSVESCLMMCWCEIDRSWKKVMLMR